jgi:4-alpha-glucanotransferase
LKRAGDFLAGTDRFVTLKLPLPDHLPWGYNRLALETQTNRFESLVISAPSQAYWPQVHRGQDEQADGEGERGDRTWGCFLPLYALRSSQDWGAGDFSDMQRLISWTAELGGTVLASLPLLASYLDDPCDPSPYAPVSRLFWNEFYVDPRQVPELEHCPRAKEIIDSQEFAEEVTRLRTEQLIDYRQLAALKRNVLETLADHFFRNRTARFDRFSEFVRADPALGDYARFRATHERQQAPWQQWPSNLRDGVLKEGDCDQHAERYHCFVQWLAAEQLQAIASHAGRCGCELYLDLPLGVRGDGYDMWRYRTVFASGVTAGAPPDAVWTGGQNWGFSPFHPDAIREEGYQHVRDFLSRQFRMARFLRIDHVMGLHHLFWVPEGMSAQDGAYVQYRMDEWCAILCLESHRHQTGVVGEHLGTVPEEVNRSMRRHHIRHTFVVEYELESEDQPQQPSDPRCVASLNAFDAPLFAAWWRDEDLELRCELELLDAEGLNKELERRDKLKRLLAAWLRDHGWLDESQPSLQQIVSATQKLLASSPAEMVIVNLEDLWGQSDPQNISGAAFARMNWRHKAICTFDEIKRHGAVTEALRQVNRIRRQGRMRKKGSK